MILYCKAGKDFLPTELYIDIMIMVKMFSSVLPKQRLTHLMDVSGSFFLERID